MMSSDLPPMGIGPDSDQEVSFHSRSEDSVQVHMVQANVGH